MAELACFGFDSLFGKLVVVSLVNRLVFVGCKLECWIVLDGPVLGLRSA